MLFLRKRLLIWLVRAYLRKWGKTIAIFFITGLFLFSLFLRFSDFIVARIPLWHKESIGMVGAYTLSTLPQPILSEMSRGLTAVDARGMVTPDVASAWEIKDEGKTYVFTLKPKQTFNDGTELNAHTIDLHFANVVTERPDEKTILFRLKDSYSPFLVSASRPIFRKGFVGLGEYNVGSVKRNGDFIETLTLISAKNRYKVKTYNFYPSQEALKVAFLLGEVAKAVGVFEPSFKKESLADLRGLSVEQHVRYTQLATVFFDTKDATVSDPKVRSSLAYAVANTFPFGQRNYSPFPPDLWVVEGNVLEREQNSQRAKELLSAASKAWPASGLTLTLKTLPRYKKTAEILSDAWKDLGVTTNVEFVETFPATFQVFLGDFKVPKDPDQYMLWHKDQENNLTRYSSPRIDKLLEDGRKIVDLSERKKIYTEFQKYLLADSPAIFLYFPYEYTISRK